MDQGLKTILVLSVCLVFVGLNLLLFSHDHFWLLAMPIVIGLLAMLFLDTRKVLLAAFILTPLSFRTTFENFGISVNVPAEPIVVLLMMILFLKMVMAKKIDREVFTHPITILLLLNLLWILITAITSELPLVSVKFFLSRLWYVSVFFFLTLWLLKKYPTHRHLLFYYAIPMVLLIFYITFLHSQWGFDRKAGIWIVRPFFNDHTNYAATLALIMPFLIVSVFNKQLHLNMRALSAGLGAFFFMGILLSFSRASWLSVLIAASVAVLLLLKPPRWAIFAGAITIMIIGFAMQPQIRSVIERNPYQSSGDMAQHLRSITNVTTDASNLERMNRWRAAIRMFQERPVVGWGPGTYQFVYAPFQLSEDFTIITTQFGDMGNAHSEYLGPLSESGLPGMLLFMTLAFFTIYTGTRLFYKGSSPEIKLLALGITLGFVTYFVHGLFNNFLDTDKASVPFWSMMAILVALDVYQQKTPQPRNEANHDTADEDGFRSSEGHHLESNP